MDFCLSRTKDYIESLHLVSPFADAFFFLPWLAPARNTCKHSRISKGICMDCRKILKPHPHCLQPEERLAIGMRGISRLKNINSADLLSKKKLHLVLDLDNTLLHSKSLMNLTSEEKTLKSRSIFVPTLSNMIHTTNSTAATDGLFELEIGYLVKLRPFVKMFLKEASSMFEIWVCTKGTQDYAEQVMKILDNGKGYLSKSRLLAREVLGGGRKSLDLVMARESCTVIIDDSKSVWDADNVVNLIEIGAYIYFANNNNNKGNNKNNELSYFEKKGDEGEFNGGLASVLRVLKQIHWLVFNKGDKDDITGFKDGGTRDVRVLLKEIRGEILKGCNIHFSRDEGADRLSMAWRMAEEMGSGCSNVLDSSITHVVSFTDAQRESCLRAKKEKRHVVHPNWVYAAYFLWRKQPEEDYPPLPSS